MATELNINGKYPIENTENWISFETLWKEEFSTLPETPHDWEEREIFKTFARKIYDRIVDAEMQGLATQAYYDGYTDGINIAHSSAHAAVVHANASIERRLQQHKEDIETILAAQKQKVDEILG